MEEAEKKQMPENLQMAIELVLKMNEPLNQFRRMLGELAPLIESYPGAIQDVSEQTFRIGASIQLKLLRLFGWTYDDFIARLEQYVQAIREEYAQSLHDMDYKVYLLTPHWKRLREQALGRARHRCQVCNASSLLNVHHRTYERRGFELDHDLIVLCNDCHQLFHEHRKLAKLEASDNDHEN